MIERRAIPVHRRMADAAILWKAGGLVVGIIRPVIVIQVARDASAARERKVISHVALRALQAGVHAGQCEPGIGVIELRTHPLHRRMAQSAVLRESGRLMIGVGGRIVVVQMAIDASRIRKGIVVVHVALQALQAGMRSGQREAGRGMIERRACPLRRVVAPRAILREIRCLVVRIAGRVVVIQMARDASAAR